MIIVLSEIVIDAIESKSRERAGRTFVAEKTCGEEPRAAPKRFGK
jgi:hypothetical protein